jgi:hypothetical protein
MIPAKKKVSTLSGQPVWSNFQLPELDQLDNRLRTPFHIELLHDIRYMISDSFFTDKQLLGDLPGRLVLHEKFKHFAFPIR